MAASCSGSASCVRALGRQLIFRGAAGADSALLEAGSSIASVVTTTLLYLHVLDMSDSEGASKCLRRPLCNPGHDWQKVLSSHSPLVKSQSVRGSLL